MSRHQMEPDQFTSLKEEIITCRQCPRLVAWREKVGLEKRRAFREQEYWAKPVPGFGDIQARVLILGLAPGAHGSNRTGRMFTGDDSGKFLYAALHRAGFANQSWVSDLNDGLQVNDLWISAVCRCAPPDNKPTITEIHNCRGFLIREYSYLEKSQGIVAFGKIAYDEAFNLIGFSKKQSIPKFGHGVYYNGTQNQPWILASYHPSRQNTQTGRLATVMFDDIWSKVRRLLAID